MTEKRNPSKLYDVAVIGAGPSGLTAALAFAQKGLDTLLLAPEVNHSDGRTTALLQESVAFLEALDVWGKLAPKAAPLRRMRLIDDTGRLIRAPEVTFDSAELDMEAYGYNLLNIDLNTVLEQEADAQKGLTFVRQAAAGYELGEDVVTIEDASGATYQARLAVAADGRNSLLRKTAGIDVKRWGYPQVALVLNLAHDLPHGDVSTEFHTPTGPFTLVPLPGRNSSLVCVETEAGADRLYKMQDAYLEQELEQRAHSILGKFKIASERQRYPLSGLAAKTLVGRRVALIGETAHVFPPIGAQGLNLSLRDVAALVRLIGSAHDRGADIGSASVLAVYERERRADISSRTAAVDALNRSLLNGFLPIQLARSAGLYLADRIGPLRRFLMREGIAPGAKPLASSLFPRRKSA
ncbi:UbiH/UbiF family hydroxylase [Roseibium aggregatum]|uniref:UbiH/UbiF family hydroxylase n=1 Tax=Roseibium aggregatum TaxID=187304 RepID=A0A926S6E4_9HYPH|nr:UbiH/UbiF family hydroxylase [Roseibium aggregatum]MBD1546397.1 UbiH/UbiF family hydroxylase [Roseibium aggregatum]